MDDFSKLQADNLKDFVAAKDKAAFLDSLLPKLDTVNQVYDARVGGKKLSETDIYKSHAPVFKQIYETLLFKTLMATATRAMDRFAQPTGDAEENVEATIGGLFSLASQTTPEEQNKIIAGIFLPNEDIVRILKGLADYEAESNDTYSNKNETLKKKRAVELYKDAYELYWKIVRDIYLKETGSNRKAVEGGHKNKDILKHFAANHPLLSKSVNNLLRNDASHLNYTEREKYTSDELLVTANEVVAELLTAIAVQLQLFRDLFDMTVPALKQFLGEHDM